MESSRASLKLQGLLPGGPRARNWSGALSTAVIPNSACCITLARICRAGSNSAWNSPSAIKTRCPGASAVRASPQCWFRTRLGRAIQAAQMGRRRLQVDLQPRPGLPHSFRCRAGARSAVRRIRARLFSLCRSDLPDQTGRVRFHAHHSREFHFELYSSGEYSRMLERSWSE